MTQQTRRYTAAGPDPAPINNSILPGGATVSGIVVTPTQYLDVVLSDDAAAQDLDDYLVTLGWAFSEADPSASAAKTVKQIRSNTLGADSSQLVTNDGWVDVLTKDLTTKGGTTAGTLVTAVGSAGVEEGRARLLVDGGAFSDQVVGADYHAIALLTRGTVCFHGPVSIPATGSETTYTFKLQMQATGVLGTLTPLKGCALTATEYA